MPYEQLSVHRDVVKFEALSLSLLQQISRQGYKNKGRARRQLGILPGDGEGIGNDGNTRKLPDDRIIRTPHRQ